MVGNENGQVVKDYDALTSALIQLADITKEDLKLNSSCKLLALSSLRSTHVQTHHLQVNMCILCVGFVLVLGLFIVT